MSALPDFPSFTDATWKEFRALIVELKDLHLERCGEVDTLLQEKIAWYEEKSRLLNEHVRLVEEIIALREKKTICSCTVT